MRNQSCSRIWPAALVLSLALTLGAASVLHAQTTDAAAVHVTVVAPGYHLVSNATGNLLVVIGKESSFVAGVQDPTLVARAVATLREANAPPVKFAVIVDADRAVTWGDGGWGQQGAVTMAHELLVGRMSKARAGVLPTMGFSEVIQLHLADEEPHIMHQRTGYTDAETYIHFERAGIAYLPSFTSDGYPPIDAARGGKVADLQATVDFFSTRFAQGPDHIEPIIPGRGPAATLADLREFAAMLRGVTERVQALVAKGTPLADIIASKPTAAFDARWGRGPVTPDQFVTMVHASLSR